MLVSVQSCLTRVWKTATSSRKRTALFSSATSGSLVWLLLTLQILPPATGMQDTSESSAKWESIHLRQISAREFLQKDVVYFDGSDPIKMHNYYTHLYNECVFNVLKEYYGENKACLFARSATAGGQQFPVHWGGDCSANYNSMAEVVRGCLSLCISGFGFTSHDMAGFEATATPRHLQEMGCFRYVLITQPSARKSVLQGAMAVRRGIL